MRHSWFILCWLPVLSMIGPLPVAGAGIGDDRLCDIAAQRAAAATSVPEPLLRAVALAETGLARSGRMTAWPWTVNVSGQGHWFASRAEAERFLAEMLTEGAENADIGCFQISHRWHGKAFLSPAAMFDPDGNALYAAQFLSELKHRHGTWDAAVAAYHSTRPEAGRQYLLRVAEMIEHTGEVTTSRRPGPSPGTESRFGDPSTTGLGSIFPLPGRNGPLIGKVTE